MKARYPAILESYRERVDAALGDSIGKMPGPPRLVEAMAYSLLAGGKRIKSVLLLATFDVFNPASGSDPLPVACAFEFIHTYSLIHDDLPAMDNDDFRRGLPSSHRRFGEATAILAGDALLTEAFRLVADACGGDAAPVCSRVLREISTAAGASGMVGGQVLDTLEAGRAVNREGLEMIHRMKTGALIASAVKCGAILGGADGDGLNRLDAYGRNVGLAFQVMDDVLDVVGEREALGKSVGKDEAAGKNTYVKLMGIEGSRDYAARLASEAVERLVRFGERAAALRAMASFVVERAS
jgi:geranylgeranyl diphosphate synthase type II